MKNHVIVYATKTAIVYRFFTNKKHIMTKRSARNIKRWDWVNCWCENVPRKYFATL